MFSQLLPRHIDNTYRGYAAGLWILGVLLLLRAIISVNSILNGYNIAAGDGIPLESFTPAAVQTVVSLFALSAFSRLVTTLFGVLILFRYRAMVPLLFVVLLLEHVGRAAVLRALPIPGAAGPPGSIITVALLALTAIGLALSMRLHPRAAAPGEKP